MHPHSYTATLIPGRRLLHAPGPTPLPEAVQDALRRQPMDLGDPRVIANIQACEAGVQRLLDASDAKVFFYAANGHGAWEAVVENILPPGSCVLIPGTGHFSEGWATQTEALGRRVVRTEWKPGWPIDLDAVSQTLREDRAHEIRAVFAVHTDTSSSITSDMAALRAAIDQTGHPALLVVDMVASLGVTPLRMHEVGADVVVSASQKGLMCPPGVGITVANARALVACEANSGPRFYWDWRLRNSDLSYRKFCGTAPQNIMFAMEAALGLIEQEGLAQVYARHALLGGMVRAAVEGWSTAGALDFYARDPATRSASVTTVSVPEGTDVDALREVARERFQMAMAGGLGPITGKAFRIGHMGDQNPAMVLGALGAVQAALMVQGIAHGADGVQRAVAYLARHGA